jgi:phenylalanine-4-hydroxylase
VTDSPASRIQHQHTDRGALPVYATGVVAQPWSSYSRQEHATWGRLYARQRQRLQGRACDAFLHAQAAMGMDAAAIPRFDQLNEALAASTGWQLVGVEGLLPELDFFGHLAARRFPVTWWIRRPEQLDYIAEPDLFHDLFGHVPLLMDPRFANYLQAYGAGGLRAHAMGTEAMQALARLYWYTVEFGLVRQADGLRIYGAGILSSPGESEFALASAVPNRLEFSLERVMRTRYRIDDFQKTYFVIDSFEQLMQATAGDFGPVYAALAGQPALAAGAVLPSDAVIQRGSGQGWREDGDV